MSTKRLGWDHTLAFINDAATRLETGENLAIERWQRAHDSFEEIAFRLQELRRRLDEVPATHREQVHQLLSETNDEEGFLRALTDLMRVAAIPGEALPSEVAICLFATVAKAAVVSARLRDIEPSFEDAIERGATTWPDRLAEFRSAASDTRLSHDARSAIRGVLAETKAFNERLSDHSFRDDDQRLAVLNPIEEGETNLMIVLRAVLNGHADEDELGPAIARCARLRAISLSRQREAVSAQAPDYSRTKTSR